MKILVIEDDANKHQHLIDFLEKKFRMVSFVTKKSYQSGLREALRNSYNLIILDMSLPTYDINPPHELGGPFRTFAGEEILSELQRRSVNQRALVVTQFDSFGEGQSSITLEELKLRLRTNYPGYFIDAIYYNAFETSWQEEILNIISNNNGDLK